MRKGNNRGLKLPPFGASVGARVTASTASVRSQIRSRPDSANSASSQKVIGPAAKMGSLCSHGDTKSAPALPKPPPMIRPCCVLGLTR